MTARDHQEVLAGTGEEAEVSEGIEEVEVDLEGIVEVVEVLEEIVEVVEVLVAATEGAAFQGVAMVVEVVLVAIADEEGADLEEIDEEVAASGATDEEDQIDEATAHYQSSASKQLYDFTPIRNNNFACILNGLRANFQLSFVSEMRPGVQKMGQHACVNSGVQASEIKIPELNIIWVDLDWIIAERSRFEFGRGSNRFI